MPRVPAAIDPAAVDPAPTAWALAEIGLIFTLFFIHGAWPVPEVNETHYLAKAKHFWQPDWCPSDFFLNTRDAHQTFYWTFGWLAGWLTLPQLAWCGRLTTWWLLAWAWRRLSAAVTSARLAAVLSAALFVAMTFRAHLAGEWVIGGVEAKGFAFVALLLGLAALAQGRWNAVWLLLGLASAFHVVLGAWSVIAAGAVWLSLGRSRPPLWAMLPALLGGLVVALPGLVPGLLLARGADPTMVDEANRLYVFERLPHHLVLYRMPAWFIQRHLLLIGAWAVLAWLTRSRAWPAHSAAAVPDPASPAISPGARVALSAAPRVARAPIALINRFVLACIGIAAAGAVVTWSTLDTPALAARVLRYYWYRMTDFATPLGLGLSVAAWLGARLGTASYRGAAAAGAAPWYGGARCSVAALALALGVAGYHFGEVIVNREQLKRKDGYSAQADVRLPDLKDWIAVCRWIVTDSPIERDALFLTPRASQSFRWYAQRGEVVSNKDIPQDAAGIVAWWERLQDVHRGGTHREPSPWHASLSELTPARLRLLGAKYGARYVITAAQPPLDLPRIGPDGLAYAIYRLDPPPAAGDLPAAAGAPPTPTAKTAP